MRGLPLPLDALPASIRKFGDPDAPGPAKMMAAKGLVPVKGNDLITLLVQISADANEKRAETARGTLLGLPEAVVSGACRGSLLPEILDGLASILNDEGLLEALVENAEVADETLERLAKTATEGLAEVIATNQQRLLGAPKIIEALYKNPQMRMSTADRLIELAARNGVTLGGISSFEAHVQALEGQLIPEPSDEPTPDDILFRNALAEDFDDKDIVEQDQEDGTEKVVEKAKPLHFRVREMNLGQKLRLAVVGSAAARALLVRDPNKQVAMAAVSSPSMREAEVVGVANSKEVSEDVLRYVGRRREWLGSHEIKRALVFNPKTPLTIALSFMGHMRKSDLKTLSRSRSVPGPLKNAAAAKLKTKR